MSIKALAALKGTFACPKHPYCKHASAIITCLFLSCHFTLELTPKVNLFFSPQTRSTSWSSNQTPAMFSFILSFLNINFLCFVENKWLRPQSSNTHYNQQAKMKENSVWKETEVSYLVLIKSTILSLRRCWKVPKSSV